MIAPSAVNAPATLFENPNSGPPGEHGLDVWHVAQIGLRERDLVRDPLDEAS